MMIDDFDYVLPPELIAQFPLERRDASRLMVVDRQTGVISDRQFRDVVDIVDRDDVIVLNDTKVIPARLFGQLETGGKLEMLMIRSLGVGVWEALVRPARKARPGAKVEIGGGYSGRIIERRLDGLRVIEFAPKDVDALLERHGEVALPPYIREKCSDPGRYQTVYAANAGAVAAPTAGLHFTTDILKKLSNKGVQLVKVTLHAGIGTFRPVKARRVEEHVMHPEAFELSVEAAEQINAALAQGRRIVSVGTTVVRVLEGQAVEGRVIAGKGLTSLYIYPGYHWQVTDTLLTNFHLPRSTLLVLVAALAGYDLVMKAYRHAVEERYRFFSFGDAMLVV